MAESEDTSTHSMVVGLHRRFDNLERDVDSLKSETRVLGERIIRLDSRVDVAETKAEAAEKRESILFAHVHDSVRGLQNGIEKLTQSFVAHAEGEEKDRKKVMFWLMGTAFSVLISIGMILFNRVFG